MGARVAEIALAARGPRVVLSDHLLGEAPILLHRVSDLEHMLAEHSAAQASTSLWFPNALGNASP